ncbi:hypothetical protein [Archangium lansingense]|uniref:Lipoprotein n=1 Tax=Archangium lansingense TaxID=2995310 RepID=A0ABT4A5E9_9BACT|nr:hypothetical protein [Archangium lansinium]MCY1076876.1 hypothetical protein [Archangium lansinium]
MATHLLEYREVTRPLRWRLLAVSLALLAVQLSGCAVAAQAGAKASGPTAAINPVVEVGAGLPFATAGLRVGVAPLDVGLTLDGRAPIPVTGGELGLVLVPHLGLELLSYGTTRNGDLGYLSPRAGLSAVFMLDAGNPQSFFFVDLMGGLDQPFSPQWRRWYGGANVGVGFYLRPWIGG